MAVSFLSEEQLLLRTAEERGSKLVTFLTLIGETVEEMYWTKMIEGSID